MKAKDLAAILLQYPEFEVTGMLSTSLLGERPVYLQGTVEGYDIGHSDKVVNLSLREKD